MQIRKKIPIAIVTVFVGGLFSFQTSLAEKTNLIIKDVNLVVNQINEVKIGNQIWMAQNLNVSRFRNGDSIPHAKSAEDWEKAGKEQKPAWCYYNNEPTNESRYGKLYNWYAVNDPRGLAPEGWHIPSDLEWKQLTDYIGGNVMAGKKLKSTKGWA